MVETQVYNKLLMSRKYSGHGEVIKSRMTIFSRLLSSLSRDFGSNWLIKGDGAPSCLEYQTASARKFPIISGGVTPT